MELRAECRGLRCGTKSTIQNGKTDKLDFIKIVKRMKRQALTREKIFANHVFDKGSRCIRNFQNTAIENPGSPTRLEHGQETRRDILLKRIYKW